MKCFSIKLEALKVSTVLQINHQTTIPTYFEAKEKPTAQGFKSAFVITGQRAKIPHLPVLHLVLIMLSCLLYEH